MSHALSFTITCPWATSWRALGRFGAKPSRWTTLSRRRSMIVKSCSPVFSGEREAISK